MPLMRRRPLLRAAAVGGGAYMAGKRRERKQMGAEDQAMAQAPAQPAPQAPPPPAAGPSTDTIERLKELGQLHEQGVLTDQEFSDQKAKLLAG